jgi:hypothetical protein
MAAGKYSMELDPQKKIFSIYAEGSFSAELGQKYVEEFVQKSNSIEPTDWILTIDVINLNTVGNDAAKILMEVLKLYLSFPYKKRYITTIRNSICNIQVKNMGKSVPNFDGLTWVDTLENI